MPTPMACTLCHCGILNVGRGRTPALSAKLTSGCAQLSTHIRLCFRYIPFFSLSSLSHLLSPRLTTFFFSDRRRHHQQHQPGRPCLLEEVLHRKGRNPRGREVEGACLLPSSFPGPGPDTTSDLRLFRLSFESWSLSARSSSPRVLSLTTKLKSSRSSWC